MKLFCAYLRQHRKGLVLFAVFALVFAAGFFLYHLPPGAVLYPTLVCALLGVVFVVFDFSRVRRKHRLLCGMRKMTSAMIGALPEPQGPHECDYQAIIRALQKEVSDVRAEGAARYQDMTDYYTVWVHQIKTPITSMRLTLEKEDTALSRKLSSDLFQIERYVEMVLAYLRLDAESSDYVLRPYALDDIIEDSVTKFAGEFIARKIRLSYTPTGATVVTDEKWLSFVLEQLLSNALKYTRAKENAGDGSEAGAEAGTGTEAGTITIDLSAPQTLRIADTGIGIAPADLPRVFEKGYTGFNGRIEGRASGIGLYLCRKICKNLGIRISIDSELGKGTTVLLDLSQYPLKSE